MVQLVPLVAHDHAELVPAGALGGDEHLAAQFLTLVVQGHFVPAQSGDLGGPHTGRPAADNHDPLLAERRPQMVLTLGRFGAGRRVLHAADGLVEAHPTVAVLVAGDAVADLLGAPFSGFPGEVRIG